MELESVCKTDGMRFDSASALLEDNMKAESLIRIYGKYEATYIGPDKEKEGRHWVTVLQGPDKGRTLTVPKERLNM